MKIDELNKKKIPLVKINKDLNKYKGKVLFKKKLEKANKLLERAKLPNELISENKYRPKGHQLEQKKY